MTDEEKKAIDDLFSLTHINGYINLYDQKKANIYTSDLKRWQNSVKVLLNLIQTQQEEIEKKDALINTMGAEFERLEDLEDNTDMLKLELQKKDKIIDEMAKYIASLDMEEDICVKNVANTELCNEEYSNCKECVKEYFINKVEKESK